MYYAITKENKKMKIQEKFAFLKAGENRESFFRRISLFFPKSDYRYKKIEQAYNVTKDAFRDVKREGGDRYFEHIRAVCLILIDYLRVNDYELIIAALLHDIVEDCPSWTIERVRTLFGDRVACFVDYLTKPSKVDYPKKEEREHVYHYRFNNAPRDFFSIKLSDRFHNLFTLESCPKDKQERKIKETRLHYLVFAEKHFILYHEIIEVLESLEKERIPQ